MTLWTMWLDFIGTLLGALSSELGLGLAVVVMTLLLRAALLPVSWSVAYRNCVRHKKLMRLQPELERLRRAHGEAPAVYFEKMSALYRKHGLRLLDGRSVVGAIAQMPVLLGMFQVLRSIGEGVRFLWVPSLLKPDAWLAVVAGATTALMVVVNPDMPEQTRLLFVVVPSVLAIVFALKFSSALALYWATSNCFSALQTVAVHFVAGRNLGSGRLKL